jgi:DNA adenine methylase
LPSKIQQNMKIKRYVEPFLGGGALYFYLKKNYIIEESYLSDNNQDLILTYNVIKNYTKQLIDRLKEIESEHLEKIEEHRKNNYYKLREAYNNQDINYIENQPDTNQIIERAQQDINEIIERASYFIFLNKTCYNGLYRLNSNGKFNVPFGRYKNPVICNENNLHVVAETLKNTLIYPGDFHKSEKFITKESFVYLDPPYRPLNSTSNFTAYSGGGFNDNSQMELAKFFREIDRKGAMIMLSNSDPQNHDENDKFFDDLYHKYKIERVPAKRNINRDANKRGMVNELIIRNYR